MKMREENTVSSFETGIIVSSRSMVGMCIKWSFYDHSEKLTHWNLPELKNLMEEFRYYGENGQHNNFMFKLKENPELEKDLPERHPYYTLLKESPKISEAEIGNLYPETKINKCSYKDRGENLELCLEFCNNATSSIFLHEYTVFSLYGYIYKMIEGFDAMSNHEGGIQ